MVVSVAALRLVVLDAPVERLDHLRVVIGDLLDIGAGERAAVGEAPQPEEARPQLVVEAPALVPVAAALGQCPAQFGEPVPVAGVERRRVGPGLLERVGVDVECAHGHELREAPGLVVVLDLRQRRFVEPARVEVVLLDQVVDRLEHAARGPATGGVAPGPEDIGQLLGRRAGEDLLIVDLRHDLQLDIRVLLLERLDAREGQRVRLLGAEAPHRDRGLARQRPRRAARRRGRARLRPAATRPGRRGRFLPAARREERGEHRATAEHGRAAQQLPARERPTRGSRRRARRLNRPCLSLHLNVSFYFVSPLARAANIPEQGLPRVPHSRHPQATSL